MERELIGRNLSLQDDNGEDIHTVKEVEVKLTTETLDIVRARRMTNKAIDGLRNPGQNRHVQIRISAALPTAGGF
jgi:hypothetical protein